MLKREGKDVGLKAKAQALRPFFGSPILLSLFLFDDT